MEKFRYQPLLLSSFFFSFFCFFHHNHQTVLAASRWCLSEWQSEFNDTTTSGGAECPKPDFTAACTEHEICYKHQVAAVKSTCDGTFVGRLRESCGQQYNQSLPRCHQMCEARADEIRDFIVLNWQGRFTAARRYQRALTAPTNMASRQLHLDPPPPVSLRRSRVTAQPPPPWGGVANNIRRQVALPAANGGLTVNVGSGGRASFQSPPSTPPAVRRGFAAPPPLRISNSEVAAFFERAASINAGGRSAPNDTTTSSPRTPSPKRQRFDGGPAAGSAAS